MGYYTKVEVISSSIKEDGVNIPINKLIEVQKEFCYMFGNNLYLTVNLDKYAVALFYYLSAKVDKENVVRFKEEDVADFIKFCEKLRHEGSGDESRTIGSTESVRNIMKRLKKFGAVATVRYGYVMVNPIFAGKTNGRKRKEQIKQFFVYCENSGVDVDLLKKRTKF